MLPTIIIQYHGNECESYIVILAKILEKSTNIHKSTLKYFIIKIKLNNRLSWDSISKKKQHVNSEIINLANNFFSFYMNNRLIALWKEYSIKKKRFSLVQKQNLTTIISDRNFNIRLCPYYDSPCCDSHSAQLENSDFVI